jgi:hypothetical protein
VQTGTVVISLAPGKPRDAKGWLVSVDDSKTPVPPSVPPGGTGPAYPGDTVHWDIAKSAGCVIKFVT